jgi:hypothetical protein
MEMLIDKRSQQRANIGLFIVGREPNAARQ